MADRRQQVLIGAWAVAPLAGEWIHQAVLAIKTGTPIAVLRDTVAQFPTFSEAFQRTSVDARISASDQSLRGAPGAEPTHEADVAENRNIRAPLRVKLSTLP